MQLSDKALEEIKKSEAWVPRVYPDQAGLPTIGYGHLITREFLKLPPVAKETQETLKAWNAAAKVAFPNDISLEYGLQLLKQDVGRFEAGVSRLVKVPLNQNQFDALVDFAFNVGIGALATSTLLKRLNAGDYSIGNEFLKWNKIRNKKTGKLEPLLGLTKRREREAALFATPV